MMTNYIRLILSIALFSTSMSAYSQTSIDKQSQELIDSVRNTKDNQTAQEYLYLGNIKIIACDYEGAFEYYKRGAEMFDTISAKGVVTNRLKCLRGMGNAKFLMHDYAEALVYFKQELAGYAALDPYGADFAKAYTDVAKTLKWLNNSKAALPYYEEAAALYEKLGMTREYELVMGDVKLYKGKL